MTSGPLLWIEVALGLVIVVFGLFLVFTWIRRRSLAHGQPLVLCGMRTPGETRWRGGLLRYETGRLDWFSLGGFSMRPRHRWQRGLLEIDTPQQLEGRDRPVAMPGAVGVPCRHGSERFELTMTREHYTALRSWLESCPPGHNVNVA